MIDTVVINLPSNQYNVIEDLQYSATNRKGFYKRIFNPTKEQKSKYGYLPRATEINAIRNGGYQTYLAIEFSIPKILHGNNFDEVADEDFPDIIDSLWSKILYLGIQIIDKSYLYKARVTNIHYSKNIILIDHSTPYHYISEFRKLDISKRYDIDERVYRNGGTAYRYHSNNFEMIFYDKLKDFEQIKVLDKDNYIQTNMFKEISKKEAFEVLRLELRLRGKRKIDQMLGKINITKLDLNFENLCKKEISQNLLLYVLEQMEAMYPRILNTGATSQKDFVIKLQLAHPKMSYPQILKYSAIYSLLSKLGVREYRELMAKHGNKKWSQTKKSLGKLNLKSQEPVFIFLKQQLHEFNPVSIENYKENM